MANTRWQDQVIRRIHCCEVHGRYPRQVGVNARLGIHGTGPTSPVAIIETDAGATGWGLAYLNEDTVARVSGRPLEKLFDPSVGVIDPVALPLDIALHDLVARILDIPVYAMLGSRGETVIPCYDGAIYMDDLLPFDAPQGIDAVLANCCMDHALGYRAFKLKIGRGNRWMEPGAGLQRDIEVTKAVRDAYPDAQILVDANDGYACEGFLRYLDAVADCDLFWIEEPFRETAADLTRLRQMLDEVSPATRIADGEADPDLEQLLQLAADGLLQVLLPDMMGYGLTPWRAYLPRAVAAGVLTSPHAWGQPLKTFYIGQFAAGMGHVLTIEGVPGTHVDVDDSAYQLIDGMLHVPDRPGFGLDLVQ